MARLLARIFAALLVFSPAPALAQDDPQEWGAQGAGSPSAPAIVLFVDPPPDLPFWQPPRPVAAPPSTQRLVGSHRADAHGARADYGPFRVLDAGRVALVGETDSATPVWFARLMREHPGLAWLEMIECPGTLDDRANMRLGRMIRAAGLATHVPAHGSVRSGAVELFLAGVDRTIEEGAEFAVHSWRDAEGREARDFAAGGPENRAYLDYYREMGMDQARARAFYDFTNSVPHHRALWLEAADMRPWLKQDPAPRIAYVGLT